MSNDQRHTSTEANVREIATTPLYLPFRSLINSFLSLESATCCQQFCGRGKRTSRVATSDSAFHSSCAQSISPVSSTLGFCFEGDIFLMTEVENPLMGRSRLNVDNRELEIIRPVETR